MAITKQRRSLFVMGLLMLVIGIGGWNCAIGGWFQGMSFGADASAGSGECPKHECDCVPAPPPEGGGGGEAALMTLDVGESTTTEGECGDNYTQNEFGITHCADCGWVCFDHTEPPHNTAHLLVERTPGSDPHVDAMPCGCESADPPQFTHWWRCTDPTAGEGVDCGLVRWYLKFVEPYEVPASGAVGFAGLVLMLLGAGVGSLRFIVPVLIAGFVFAAPTRAGTFAPERSWMGFQIGGKSISGGTVGRPGNEGSVQLIPEGAGLHRIEVLESGIFATANVGMGTSLFTASPLMTNIKLSLTNEIGSFTPHYVHVNHLSVTPGGGHETVGPQLGGGVGLRGEVVMFLLDGMIRVPLDLGPVGGTATQTQTGAGLATVQVQHGPWVTGPTRITGITTNVVSIGGVTGVPATLWMEPWEFPIAKTLSTGGGYLSTGTGLPLERNTVTLSGSNQLMTTGSGDVTGQVMLVSPMRINTSQGERLPGGAWMRLVFVPEPGTLLLLVSGAIGLLVIGRRRMI